MAWLAMRAKTACPGSRMRKGAITESAVVLKRWAIFPAKEQALAHFEEGSIVASFDEVAGCASWMGGRIPTMEEARSIYSYVDASKNKELQALGNTIPAVNGCVH